MDMRGVEANSTSLFFGDFYGTQYCKSLTKDLEKFKDEFYDGQSARFLREWVQPTVELLRRLQEMGFPIRTQNHIVIHLYNPVDSMAAGEFHFQVGRKAPGKLTLKFTKMAPNCTYMIQPRSLSVTEERKLCLNPQGYLDQIRAEMRGAALDAANILRTVVLMTDNCQLERCCATILFGYSRRTDPMHSLNGGGMSVDAMTKSNPPRMQVTTDMANFNVPSNVPVNVCFKNYVHYGKQGNPSEAVASGSGTRFAPITPNASAPYSFGSTRSMQLRSEPEEDDETVKQSTALAANQGYGATYRMPAPANRPSVSQSYNGNPQPNPNPNPPASPNAADRKRPPEPYGHVANQVHQGFERSVSSSTTNSRSSNESLDQTWHDLSPYSRKLSVKTTVLDEYATGNNHLSGPSSDEFPQLPVDLRAHKGRSSSYDAQMTTKMTLQSASPRTWSVDAYMDSEGSSGEFDSGSRLQVPAYGVRTGTVSEYADEQRAGGSPVRNAALDQCANNGFASSVSRANNRFDSWVSHGDEESIAGSLMIPAPVQELNRTLRQMRLQADNRDN